MAEFENRIKFFRDRKNLTQQELAEHLGVTVRTLRRWESGEAVPDVLIAIKISSFLGEKLENIFRFS